MHHIGTVRIDNRLVLAPMAGVNCTAFRLMCKKAGAGLICTQMYHSDFVCSKGEGIIDFINIQEEERPVSVQLVGYNPESMAKAAKIISKIADIIDINFGCCDTNIIKSGAGAHFSRFPEKIPDMVKAVIGSTDKPVTAKIRIGYDSQNINGVATAQMLEKIGCAAITVHGRVATQKYAGKANWQIIKHIKERLNIPLIGSGDVKDIESLKKLFETTRCDFAMIGRRAMGDPGVFTRLSGGKQDVKKQFNVFAELYSKYDTSFSELRTHALWFAKRARLGPKSRNRISLAKDKDSLLNEFCI